MLDPNFFTTPKGIFLLLLYMFWILPWKGFALWKAAKNKNVKWFIVLLVVNTLALLEIIYIFYFSKKKPSFRFPWNKN